MEMSTEQFQTFLQRVAETINGTVNPRLNTPGSVGKNSFTETLKKDLERLDTKNFTDWKFKLEIAARAVHPGYADGKAASAGSTKCYRPRPAVRVSIWSRRWKTSMEQNHRDY